MEAVNALEELTRIFAKYPAGSRLTGRNRTNTQRTGYLSPIGFGVISASNVPNYGRTWVRLHENPPVNGEPASYGESWNVWADTLLPVREEPQPVRPQVIAHLLVEVTLEEGVSTVEEACQTVDHMLDGVLNLSPVVNRFYIRQLGTATP